MKKIILLLIAIILFAACNDTKEQEEILQAKIIETHDVLMQKGETIMANKESINKILANVAGTNNAYEGLDTEAFYKQANTLNTDLTKADEAMMAWMNNFNPDFAGKNHTQIMEYLNKQKAEIDKVETITEKALKNSDIFIKQYKK
ncbi:MAG: hypothetical protein EAZ51_02425 [Sphingobacteriales bacterium]|nr:MAG: hypothetical protein EAZ64_03360 [Sphingobacteriales bacterium]TAF82411.1 MAG: hypothetical protein EAZ51_02425 [Sphingobacteriales bacterium]